MLFYIILALEKRSVFRVFCFVGRASEYVGVCRRFHADKEATGLLIKAIDLVGGRLIL